MRKNIIFFLLISVISFAENSFYFVQISDTHFGFEDNFGKKKQKSHYSLLNEFVRDINESPVKIEFIAHTGDIVDNMRDDEMTNQSLNYFDKLKVPIYYLPGNNDIDPKYYFTIDNMKKKYEKRFGEMNHSNEYNGIKFIYFYNESLRVGIDKDSKEYFNWLEEELNNARDKEKIIFIHSPPGSYSYKDGIKESWDSKNEEKFKSLLEKYKVKAVICGHKHRNIHSWIGETELIVAPSFVDFEAREYKYLLYKYDNGKLSYETILLD